MLEGRYRKGRRFNTTHLGNAKRLFADENPKVVSGRQGHSSIVLTLNTYLQVPPP